MFVFGALSRPWSPLSSRPPDVDVPLPLGLFLCDEGLLDAELAAGSPVLLVAAVPPGSDVWAKTLQFAQSMMTAAADSVRPITCRHRCCRP
jgi:hypothetical protein